MRGNHLEASFGDGPAGQSKILSGDSSILLALSLQPASFPEKGYDVDGVISELVNYDRRPEDLSKEIAETVSAIVVIVGKTTRTVFNGLSLLKTPDEIQAAIQQGNLPVSQGYLFAANLDCPDLRSSL